MKKFIDEKTKQVIWIYQEMISMNYYLHNEYIHLYFLFNDFIFVTCKL